jgi:hypothetical protein
MIFRSNPDHTKVRCDFSMVATRSTRNTDVIAESLIPKRSGRDSWGAASRPVEVCGACSNGCRQSFGREESGLASEPGPVCRKGE